MNILASTAQASGSPLPKFCLVSLFALLAPIYALGGFPARAGGSTLFGFLRSVCPRIDHDPGRIVDNAGIAENERIRQMEKPIGAKSTRLLLRNISLFSGLSEAQLDDMGRIAVLRQEPRHKTIVFVGAKTDALFLIVRGSVKVLNRDAEGREVILSMLGAGECFGEMGLIDDSPRSADVVTNEPCDLLAISKADFTRALSGNAELCLNIMKNLVLRLREANQKIESLALMDVYGRVAKLLLDFSEIENGQRVMKRKITKLDMAKMVGASREMVSRVMRDLQDRGVIRAERGRIVLRGE
jgi:CRP/FNR family cyclic AMP-dependent transcriptional regulator